LFTGSKPTSLHFFPALPIVGKVAVSGALRTRGFSIPGSRDGRSLVWRGAAVLISSAAQFGLGWKISEIGDDFCNKFFDSEDHTS
jgi:hypothetical protein